MFSLICAWINTWVNNRVAGDLRRHHAHYDVIVMIHRECWFWDSIWPLMSYIFAENIKAPNQWPFVRGIHPSRVDSPHKGPVMWKHFPCHDIIMYITLRLCHNEHNGISTHRHLDCLLNRLFRHRSKKPSKLHVTGFCDGNSPVTGEFPAQRASNAENVSIWWCHHEDIIFFPKGS